MRNLNEKDFLIELTKHKDLITDNINLFWSIVLAFVIFYYKGKEKTCNHHAGICKKIKRLEEEFDEHNDYASDTFQWAVRHIYLLCAELKIKPEPEPTHRREG